MWQPLTIESFDFRFKMIIKLENKKNKILHNDKLYDNHKTTLTIVVATIVVVAVEHQQQFQPYEQYVNFVVNENH